MYKRILWDKKGVLLNVLFIGFFYWWLTLHPFSQSGLDIARAEKSIWQDMYQLVALVGSIIGFYISKSFGTKSLIGKSLIFFSLGLLLQFAGQFIYTIYHHVLGIPVPYPSLGDVGFFGSVISYIIGSSFLFIALGGRSTFKHKSRLKLLLIPLFIFLASYYFYLANYSLDWSTPLKTGLDLAYPIGEIIYVSITFLCLYLSKNLKQGVIKYPLVIILIALILQYLSDFNFLYQVSRGSWHFGRAGDFFYLIAYYTLGIGFLHMEKTLEDLKVQQHE